MTARRRALTAAEAQARSERIANHLKGLLEWEQIYHLHVYRSYEEWREADTTWLERFITAEWPHIELTIGDVSRTAAVPEAVYDVVIVPLLAFDDECRRLGMGGGWYDRFLSAQPQALSVGLAYELQRAKTVPVEPHDIALDYIVTEDRVLMRSASHP